MMAKTNFKTLTHLKINDRVAITCFENDVSYCHRGVNSQKYILANKNM